MKQSEKLIEEIENVIAPKLFNIKHKTANQIQIDIVEECLGYLSLIKYSTMNIEDIKRLWDKSNLKYM